MIKNIINKKPVAVLVIVCILFSIGITVFADDKDNKSDCKIVLDKGQKDKFIGKKFEEILENLVKENKITKERATLINEQFNKEIGQRKSNYLFKGSNKKYKGHKMHSTINNLHDKKIISDEEANAIKGKIEDMRNQHFNKVLEELVNKNVITKKKSQEIQEYMIKDRIEKNSKFKNMTKEEKRSYFKENRRMKKDIINKMIEDNVISEEEGKEIRKILRKNRKRK